MMQRFYTKMAEANGETILAACDEPVAGKTFEDEKARLAVSRQFYCGTLCDEAGLVEKMRTATIINLAGDRCVEVAIRYGFVGKGRIVRIGGIAHAQAITPKYSNVE